MEKQLKDYVLEAVKGKLFLDSRGGDIYRIDGVEYDGDVHEYVFRISCYFPHKDKYCENIQTACDELSACSLNNFEATSEQIRLFREAEARFKQGKLEECVG